MGKFKPIVVKIAENFRAMNKINEEKELTKVWIAAYSHEARGIYRHPREVLGYSCKDADGSIIVERSDGKRVRLVLP
jgi:hypothetical protein